MCWMPKAGGGRRTRSHLRPPLGDHPLACGSQDTPTTKPTSKKSPTGGTIMFCRAPMMDVSLCGTDTLVRWSPLLERTLLSLTVFNLTQAFRSLLAPASITPLSSSHQAVSPTRGTSTTSQLLSGVALPLIQTYWWKRSSRTTRRCTVRLSVPPCSTTPSHTTPKIKDTCGDVILENGTGIPHTGECEFWRVAAKWSASP